MPDEFPRGWRDASTVADDGVKARRWFVDADGYAKHQETWAFAPTREACMEMIRGSAARLDAEIVAAGGTLVEGDYPDGTLFHPVPEDIFGDS